MPLSQALNTKSMQLEFLFQISEERDEKIRLVTQQYAHQILALWEISDYEHQEIHQEKQQIEAQYLEKIAEIRQEFNEKILNFSKHNSQKL